jgi:hypothetical protein
MLPESAASDPKEPRLEFITTAQYSPVNITPESQVSISRRYFRGERRRHHLCDELQDIFISRQLLHAYSQYYVFLQEDMLGLVIRDMHCRRFFSRSYFIYIYVFFDFSPPKTRHKGDCSVIYPHSSLFFFFSFILST